MEYDNKNRMEMSGDFKGFFLNHHLQTFKMFFKEQLAHP